MPTFEPIATSRLYRLIAAQIKQKIQSGAFTPGEKLPSERDIAELLRVSRPSVREALIALEIEGWVDVRVGSGVFVTASHEQGDNDSGTSGAAATVIDVGAAELLEVRLLIEEHCAELAARNASAEQLNAMEQAALALPNAEHPAEQNDEFHMLIANASGNMALASTVRHLWSLEKQSAIFNKLNQHYVYDEVWDIAHIEHLTLFTALQKRQPANAKRAMRNHLLGVGARLGLDNISEK